MSKFHLITDEQQKYQVDILSKNTAAFSKRISGAEEKITKKVSLTVDLSRFLLMRQYFFFFIFKLSASTGTVGLILPWSVSTKDVMIG